MAGGAKHDSDEDVAPNVSTAVVQTAEFGPGEGPEPAAGLAKTARLYGPDGALDGSDTVHATTIFAGDGDGAVAVIRARGGSFRPGEVVSERYEILRLIGRGGCGLVYAALDKELDVEVALKTLRHDGLVSTKAIAQLKQEILLARKVTHVNVCRIYDVGFYDGADGKIPFLTMELLPGQTLAQRMSQVSTIPLDEALSIVEQVVAALTAAHAVGVVHSDLKPGNIMLVDDGGDSRVVVTDFGLATAQAGADVGGQIVGTPAYMAPEQVEGKTLSAATDIYSFGATLYQMLTGELVFEEDTPLATARARLHERAPAVDSVLPNLPAQWTELVAACLETDPADRPASAAELLQRLAPQKKRRVPSAVWVAVLVCAGLAGTALAVVPALKSRHSGTSNDLQRHVTVNPLARASYERGIAALQRGEAHLAIYELELATQRDPSSSMALFQLARAQAFDDLKRASARETAVAAAKLADSWLNSKDQRELITALADLYSGQKSAATERLTLLRDRYPDDFEVGMLLAASHRREDKYKSAIGALDALTPPDDLSEARWNYLRAASLNEAEKYSLSLQHALRAAEFAARAGAPMLQARALAIGTKAAQHEGAFAHAVELGTQVVSIARDFGEVSVQVAALDELAAINIKNHHYAAAAKLVHERTALLEANGQQSLADQAGVTVQQIIASTGRPELALDLITDELIPLFYKTKNAYWEAYARDVRAQILLEVGQPIEALAASKRGESGFRALGSVRMRAFSELVIGYCHLALGDIEQARSLFIGIPFLVEQTHLALADAALAGGKAELAVSLTKPAVEFFEGTEMHVDRAIALELYARALLASGEARAASNALTTARELAKTSENHLLRARLDVTGLLVSVAQGENGRDATRSLRDLVGTLEGAGYLSSAFDARMAIAAVKAWRGAARNAARELERVDARAREISLVPHRYRAIVTRAIEQATRR
jgi:serine/threonine protein kinase